MHRVDTENITVEIDVFLSKTVLAPLEVFPAAEGGLNPGFTRVIPGGVGF